MRTLKLFLFMGLLVITACSGRAAQPTPTSVQAALPAQGSTATPAVEPTGGAEGTVVPTEAPSPVPTATPTPWLVTVDPAVPPELQAAAQEVVAGAPALFAWAAEGQAPDLSLQVAGERPLAEWIYAVAVPFATVADEIALPELQASWQGSRPASPVLTEQTFALLSELWGEGTAALVEDVPASLWQRRQTWSIVPFHHLSPDLKVWAIDGRSPVAVDFTSEGYPLTVSFGLNGDQEAVAAFAERWPAPFSNRQQESITRVAMTGVTALVRATAYQMEIRGLLYPAEEVAPVLQQADIAHVSNEIAFVQTCPPPYYIGDPVFCSDPRYLELLEYIGVDVVELTGNHVNDWGRQYLPYTLDLYDQAGMAYYGGGRTLEEAQQPALFEDHGNRIAFVGCNPVGPAGAWATAEWAGARPCDYAVLKAEIAGLVEQGYLVIVTLQYQELYHYAPSQQQRADFRALAEAGAAAVSGSQGHHAQGFDFHSGTFIHYGLGNLFFDQMDQLGTRQTFVDTYTIYEGRLLNVSLWTGLIENYARPRRMTPEERAQLLQTVFEASGW